jgi:hypothetical protein
MNLITAGKHAIAAAALTPALVDDQWRRLGQKGDGVNAIRASASMVPMFITPTHEYNFDGPWENEARYQERMTPHCIQAGAGVVTYSCMKECTAFATGRRTLQGLSEPTTPSPSSIFPFSDSGNRKREFAT